VAPQRRLCSHPVASGIRASGFEARRTARGVPHTQHQIASAHSECRLTSLGLTAAKCQQRCPAALRPSCSSCPATSMPSTLVLLTCPLASKFVCGKNSSQDCSHAALWPQDLRKQNYCCSKQRYAPTTTLEQACVASCSAEIDIRCVCGGHNRERRNDAKRPQP